MIINIVAIFFWFLYDVLLFYLTDRFYAKKCRYDCSKCKNWHCQYHECEGKRRKLQNSLEKES